MQLEGIFTILAGVVFTCLFPGTPKDPVSLAGVSYFSERELLILQHRVFVDDPSKNTTKKDISVSDIINTVSAFFFYLPLSFKQ